MADAAGGAPLFEITSQVETYDKAPNGSFANGVQVSFRTRSGAQGSVFVPYADYTVDAVRRLVAARAGAMDEVQQLGQGG